MRLSVGAIGVSAVIVQLTLMREMVGAFAGNELVLGIVLGNWLLATGVGSALGRWARRAGDPIRLFATGQVLVALLPVVLLCAVRVGRDHVFVRGASVGVSATATASLAVLMPYCLVSGVLLALASAILSAQHGAHGVKQVYIADAVGSVLGAVTFTYLLVPLLDHFQTLYVTGTVVLACACVTGLSLKRRPLAAVLGILVLAVLGFWTDLDGLTTRLQYPGQEIVFRGNSPYGRLVVSRSERQLTFHQNGAPVVSSGSTERAEETVHYAMAQRPGASRILLVSGGISGSAKEILKYPGVSELTYVELDPLLIETARRLLPGTLDDARIRVERVDARLFVRLTNRRFDVVIVDAPEPSTIQANRFYTAEFFGSVAHILRSDGVLGFRLGEYANYIGPELARVISSASSTVARHFGNTLLVPGNRICFLASNGPLHSDIAARLEQHRIPTRFVNPHYLDAMLTPDRFADLKRAVAEKAAANRDLDPVLLNYSLRNWMSQFGVRFGLLEGVLVLLLVAYLAQLRATPAVVFVSGLAGSALEVVLLLGVQVLFGSVYHHVGSIVMLFMAGLAAGAWIAGRSLESAGRRALASLAVILAAVGALLPPILAYMGSALASPQMMLLFGLVLALVTLAVGVVVGAIFPIASRLELVHDAAAPSRLYTADFVGASLGALFAATLLIPLLGAAGTCLVIAIPCLAAALRIMLAR